MEEDIIEYPQKGNNYLKRKLYFSESFCFNLSNDDDEEFKYAIFSGNRCRDLKINTKCTNVNGNIYSRNDFVFRGCRLNVLGQCNTVGYTYGTIYNYRSMYIDEVNNRYKHISIPDWKDKIYENISDDAEYLYRPKLFFRDKLDISDSIVSSHSISFKDTKFLGEGFIVSKNNIIYQSCNRDLTNSKVFMYSESGNIYINGGDIEFNGILYAPKGKVKICAKKFTLNGRIIADMIETCGCNLIINAGKDDFRKLI